MCAQRTSLPPHCESASCLFCGHAPAVTHPSNPTPPRPSCLCREGEEMRCVGTGARVRKIAFIGVKVYAVGLYVEAEKAAKELGVRDR